MQRIFPIVCILTTFAVLAGSAAAQAPDTNGSSTAPELAVSDVSVVTEDAEVHYGFPRVIQAANGDLLLFYRVGTTHAYDDSEIAMRRSTDTGKAWGPQRILWKAEPGYSAHNPVPLVTRAGRIILWASNYHYKENARPDCMWSESTDNGKTWSPFRVFEQGTPERSIYYVTDAEVVSGGILASGAVFPGDGVGDCHALILHSADDGKTWQDRSYLTDPDANKGDEAALLETAEGEILCILRDRQRTHTYRYWSRDHGKTWTGPERIDEMLDCVLQRPYLTRLGEDEIMLSGRDYERKKVVAYLSTDNGKTFAARTVLDSFQKDGGYTAATRLDEGRGLIVWYSDSETTALKPDIKSAIVRVKRDH